ncbi:MAG: Crp/Fnr family transcriptional regulator, partial [Chloroflexi bacterium]|nr:Crp/Fnr family transcriptional regulator [Chloroflexota bacterium]
MQKIFPWRRDRMPRSAAQDPSLVLERLRQVDIFQGLGEDDVHAIFKMVTVRECVRGTVFFTPEDPSERLYILKYGRVELYRLTPSGKRLVTRRIGPGTVFGEMSLLGQGMTGTFAEAVEPTLVCVATREDVVGFLKQRPDVALRLLEAMGQRLRTLEEQLEHA